MELEAVVTYLGEQAHYAVTPETGGIYQARLIRYEGPDVITPPETVTLVRGVRHWVGSTAESYLVDELGKAIEHRVRGSDPHAV